MESKSINAKCGHFVVIFMQNTKSIALRLSQKSLIVITCQSAITINQFQIWSLWVIFEQNTKTIALLFGQKSLIVITCQYGININQCEMWTFCGHCYAKYQGYSLTLWPKIAHFHHFSICNQNQSISNLVIFGSFLSRMPRL